MGRLSFRDLARLRAGYIVFIQENGQPPTDS